MPLLRTVPHCLYRTVLHVQVEVNWVLGALLVEVISHVQVAVARGAAGGGGGGAGLGPGTGAGVLSEAANPNNKPSHGAQAQADLALGKGREVARRFWGGCREGGRGGDGDGDGAARLAWERGTPMCARRGGGGRCGRGAVQPGQCGGVRLG